MSSERKNRMKELISNLLDLANNDGATEAEAQSALLKAKELMMKYNIDEKEILKNSAEVQRKLTGIQFVLSEEPWYYDLASIIAMNFRCMMFMIPVPEEKDDTYIIGFYGMEDDIEICVLAFNYAFSHIESHINKLKEDNEFKNAWTIPVIFSTPIEYKINGYAVGFVEGLHQMFIKQNNDHKQEWALVAVVPDKVVEYSNNNCKQIDLDKQEMTCDPNEYYKGVESGSNFSFNSFINNTGTENKEVQNDYT